MVGNLLPLDIAYWFVAVCVAWKLAWINRQTAHIPGLGAWVMRGGSTLTALLVIIKAMSRFYGDYDPASVMDISRELSICVFLAGAIVILRQRTGKY